MKKFISVLLTYSIVILFSSQSIAELLAQVDRAEINQDESITLTITSNKNTNQELNLKPLLKDFELSSTSQGSSLSIINGQQSYNKYWTLSLFPKKNGKITIPSLSLDNERSPAVSIIVHKNNTYTRKKNSSFKDEDIIIEPSVDNGIPYVNQQIIYTIKIMIKQNSGVQEISLKPQDIENTITKDLGEYKQYKIIKNNNSYSVFEKKIAFFPQKSGNLAISGFILAGTKKIKQRRSRARNPFDLFSQEFRLNSPSKPFRKTIEPIIIKVQKPLNNITPWLPAKKLTIKQIITNNNSIDLGVPITRKIITTAIGLNAEKIPYLLTKEKINAKIYQDPPKFKTTIKSNNIIGQRTDIISYIPKEPGDFKLPSLDISWFNTITNKQITNKLASREFIIQKTATAKSTNQEPKKLSPSILSIRNNKSLLNSFIQNINTNLTIIIIALSGWVFAFLLLNKKTKKNKNKPIKIKRKAINNLNELKKYALDNNQQKTTLLFIKLLKEKYPQDQLTSLQKTLNTFDFSEEFCKEINLLEQACYSQERDSWNGKNFWLMANEIFKKQKSFPIKKKLKQNNLNSDELHLI